MAPGVLHAHVFACRLRAGPGYMPWHVSPAATVMILRAV